MTTYKTSISGTTTFVNYQFRVKANNQQGAGEWSMTHGDLGPSPDVQFNFNKAIGGDIVREFVVTQELYDSQVGDAFDSVGEKWTYHQFNSSGKDFTVLEDNGQLWRVLVGAGGGGGDAGADSFYGRGGGAGEVLINNEYYGFQVNTPYRATIGVGGNGGGYGSKSSQGGQQTTFHIWTARPGGGTVPSRAGNSGNGNPGGTSGQYGHGTGGGNVAPYSGYNTDMTGELLGFGGGGNSGQHGSPGGAYPPVAARANSSAGGTAVSMGSQPTGPLKGASGVVIVAYRTG